MSTPNEEDHPIVEWEDLTDSDRTRAMQLLRELNDIFDKYTKPEGELYDEAFLPKQGT